MEITLAEMFLGAYAVAMTYLWQREKENISVQATSYLARYRAIVSPL